MASPDFLTQDARITAYLARNYAADGHFFVAVRTTGIFCRPTCAARPKPENVVFHPTRADCIEAGFRACKRCKP